jgi:Zn-dependent peptidase ImmA (M78 family)
MRNGLERFGDPRQFEIAARWSGDKESRERLPSVEGWSTGELSITVCGQVLTEHRFHGAHDSLSWYLSPIIDWLIGNWNHLLHEEYYAWPDKSGQPAAVATFSALERTIASADEFERQAYASIHAWWSRHALRASDSSAIYPDIYFRRFSDDIEISWLSRQPEFAPKDFSLTLVPGYALLPVIAVANPLWDFLAWATETAPAMSEADQALVAELKARLASLNEVPISSLEQAYIGETMKQLLDRARSANPSSDTKYAGVPPVIESLDYEALMFGGLNVELEQADVRRLLDFLASRRGHEESGTLSCLVQNLESEKSSRPYVEGYRLAEDCREELEIEPDQIFVDIKEVLQRLGISVEEDALETDAIRGVAVAGEACVPAILINTKSYYNNHSGGRRFTLAHELCHILHDRTRARKLSHLSGQWASARIEKRANAFAAMFLAPLPAIRKILKKRKYIEITPKTVREMANEFGMGVIALVEHLYNVDLIDDAARENLLQSINYQIP